MTYPSVLVCAEKELFALIGQRGFDLEQVDRPLTNPRISIEIPMFNQNAGK